MVIFSYYAAGPRRKAFSDGQLQGTIKPMFVHEHPGDNQPQCPAQREVCLIISTQSRYPFLTSLMNLQAIDIMVDVRVERVPVRLRTLRPVRAHTKTLARCDMHGGDAESSADNPHRCSAYFNLWTVQLSIAFKQPVVLRVSLSH